MEDKISDYLFGSFSKLTEKYGFRKSNELNDEKFYLVEYCSDTFVIELEKYLREFYVNLYKEGYPDDGVSLSNLLKYLNQGSTLVPVFNSFQEEKDLNECYKKQLNYISTIIYDYFAQLNDFFRSGNYKERMKDIQKFMISENPQLFKTI